MVVGRARGAQERRAGELGDHLEAERLAVERDGRRHVADVEDGVVEPSDGHAATLDGGGELGLGL